MKTGKLIPLSIAVVSLIMVTKKALGFLRSWRRGISKSRKRIEAGNKAKTRKEEIDRTLGL